MKKKGQLMEDRMGVMPWSGDGRAPSPRYAFATSTSWRFGLNSLPVLIQRLVAFIPLTGSIHVVTV